MAIDPSGLQAYQQTMRAAQDAMSSGSAAASGSDNVDFTGLVMDSISQAQGTIQGAEQASAASVVGQADLVDVVTAVSAAEVTLETVVAVRDQVVKAYQEILRMPI
ncbi:flagellar hook-basal body complex protein FliE [Maricaulis sp.]|uniref:flagellar hook-basal body complex protein FliE n=1 Tax=unclassified Maricaulis TaxID=2632371 RepID=UPI001B22486D|nr:flagellar hook-basal body complex protein FliE [Maricaulis sp.]MBO6796824.1 flagellar hook-basal body complex protein FliE [Maricaulis sp.]